ncbi:MAG: ATP-binding protein [Gammaproteobacteria bacterium]|nr:ATP-binding protein [Gammaproteobacteria bacterium]
MEQSSSYREFALNWFKKINDRFGKNDLEQFLVRFVVASIILIYSAFGEHGNDINLYVISLSIGQLYAFGYFSLLLIACYSIVSFDVDRRIVRLAMMVVDTVLFSTAMSAIPDSSAPLFFVYLLIILGFGFRFGNGYLFAAMTLSMVGFSTVIFSSEYWLSNSEFGFGYMFVMLIVSVYVSLFIRRLNRAKLKMEEAVKKADEANEAKSKFLANMSHELRTPLNGVITVSDLLSETAMSAEQKEYTDTIQTSSRALLELINDVLDFSKIESDKVILDNICFDLYACVGDVVRIIKPIADNKSISVYNNIANGTPRYMYGDPVRLKQVLINLANNAVKFTEHGHVSLHTYFSKHEDGKVDLYFDVIDTGIGIALEAQKRIFDRFVQEDDSTTRRFGGSGLGISIAKQLVELMGGDIGVSSDAGKGSRFYFNIEVEVASPVEYESLETDVVIISKNQKLVESWKKLLSGWNYSSLVRTGIKEVIDILRVWQHSKQNCTILIDEDVLQVSPVRAAQLLKSSGIKNLSLMISTVNPMQISNPGVRMYYDQILDTPVDSRQLYNALMGDPDYSKDDDVIPFASHLDHRNTKNSKPLHILVAEDQPTNQFVLRRILESKGHTVIIVDDGQQALDVLGVERFDMAILDLNMPHVSGLEVIKMYKYMRPNHGMPFAVVTANSSEEILSECREVAEAVLVKPIEKQQLLNVINKITTSKAAISGYNKSNVPTFDHLPIMDTGSLDDMLGSGCDDDFLSELFEVFNKDASRLITELAAYLQNKALLPKAKQCMHALKGISNNVSALQLAGIAKYCEDEIQTNPKIIQQADKLMLKLNSSLMATREAMKTYLSSKNLQVLD